MRFHFSIFLTLVLLGCARSEKPPSEQERAAVTAVLKPFYELTGTLIKQSQPSGAAQIARIEKYLVQCRSIDVSQCPEDFQNAWYHFLITEQLSNEKQRRGNGKEFRNLALMLGALLSLEAHPIYALHQMSFIDSSPSPEMLQAEREAHQSSERLNSMFRKYVAKKPAK